MQITNQNFLSEKDVKYSLGGKNLFQMRRARLRLLAKRLGLPSEGAKNDLLRLVVAELDRKKAPNELQDLKKFKHRDEKDL